MPTVRILVASEAGAVTFDYRGPARPLVERKRVAFEDGRRKTSEVETDRRGSAVNPTTGQSHAVGPHRSPREMALERFAKLLCQDLIRAHDDGQFEQLVLVAPAKMLGHLNHAMDKRLARHVRGTLTKDLGVPAPEALAERLGGLLPT